MKFTIPTLIFLICISTVFAGDHHQSLGAHVHGIVKLEIAVEEKKISIDLDGPTESFLGFEHSPKTLKEKNALRDAETLWTKKLLSLFVTNAELKCTPVEATFKQVLEGKEASSGHSTIEASAQISCIQNLKGKAMGITLIKHFPRIKTISLDLLGSETKIIELKKATESIKL